MTESTTDEDPIRDLLSQAISLHQEGKLAEADDYYSKVLKEEGNNAQALRLRGILARQRGDVLGSLEDLKAAIEVTPDDADALCELALSYMAAGELTPAVAALRDAVDSDPDSPKALANLGALLQYRGHMIEAVETHRRYLKLQPGDLEVLCNLAKALADAGQGDEAIREADQAVKLSDGHPLALANKGSVLCDLEQFDEAIGTLERAVAIDSMNDVALINLGYAHLSQGHLDQAKDSLQKAARANPNNARAAADLSFVLSAKDQAEEALKFCETFLARHPGERMVVAAYASALRDSGRDDEAKSLVDFDSLVKTTDVEAPADFEDLDEFHQVLAEHIENHPSLMLNPLSKSTQGGGQTGELDFEDHPALAAFEKSISEAILKAALSFRTEGAPHHSLMADPPEAWTLRAWGTVLRDGGHQTPHLHPLGWLSGNYYVRIPEDMASAGPDAGWLLFGGPPARFQTKAKSPRHGVKPKEGRLVLFPSYFYHETIPFSSGDPRISIAFDVMPSRLLKP